MSYYRVFYRTQDTRLQGQEVIRALNVRTAKAVFLMRHPKWDILHVIRSL